MSSKKKRKRSGSRVSKEARTCFVIAAIALVVGIGCIVYGNIFYNNIISLDDVTTGATVDIVSVERVDRNLSPSDKELERKKGRSDREIRYEYLVGYSIVIDGKEYTYTDTVPYRDDGKFKPVEGDTEVINYAIVDGELVVNPETREANQFNICGWFLTIVGIVALGVGLFIRK